MVSISLTGILGFACLSYVAFSMFSLTQLFMTLKCTETPCYKSFLINNPKLQLALFTSVSNNPNPGDVKKVTNIKNFNYRDSYEREITVDVPLKTRRNGTLFMHAALALDGDPLDWKTIQRGGPTVIYRFPLTEYTVPKAATFRLLGDDEGSSQKRENHVQEYKPVTHIKTKVHLVILTDEFSISRNNVPIELASYIRLNKNDVLPILRTDFFKTRLRDLLEVKRDTTEVTISLNYDPISIGKLRLMMQTELATKSMQTLGFTEGDVDEVKGIFSDTNVYLLCGTLLVSSVHIFFDFLSFKNDLIFWRKKRNYAGLSTRTTLWRAFSQFIVFLYLLDESTSLLVLIPSGISALIELWKCKKILRLEITLSGMRYKKESESEEESNLLKAEKITQDIDREAMKYLSYLLYPLCISGAVYSLIYQPHRSWYSWTLNSLVKGVYAFGFLFMLPQLFVNYKLKSVAALPWRAFMYKAFNTFIDDVFAFIITMPTAHRVACFRDDIVFIIYLYQRWLYPVDKNRIDVGASFEEDDTSPSIKEKEDNQQIDEDNQQIDEDNQQIDEDNQQFDEDNQQIDEDNEQIDEDNQQYQQIDEDNEEEKKKNK